jgi:glucose-6-phosphate isomerase/transaldolase/glucose-6-phosphate isomerase
MRMKMATTVGYGPCFLHSTGQLHKGDGGHGLFIQLTDEPETDIDIPDSPGENHSTITFGTLLASQALGDRKALRDAGRNVIRLHLGHDVSGGLQRIVALLA